MKSHKRLLDVQLLFAKAEKSTKRGLSMLKNLHNSLCAKSRNYLEQLPADRLTTEDELTSALEGLCCHIANSELYFWEHSYKLNQLTEKNPYRH